jgi:Subunit 17 of Mediator complex
MASLNSSSLPLSLRPWPRQKAGHDQLQFTIGRMQLEHGGFRQIKEDALIQEIAAAKNSDKSVDGQSAEGDAPQVGDNVGEKGTKEYIMAKKAKMMQHLGYVCLCMEI